ncbi:MAG: cytochrome c oxidase subunit 3 [Methylocystis sp.]|nr:cytochrome c oxidase subunit 3 [Methylocystis sp.]
MSVIIVFLALVAATAAWWLSRQGLTMQPWLQEGASSAFPGAAASAPAAKIGLAVFLAVVGALFALLISAYLMRMDAPDWRVLPAPRILWLNTGALIASSVALQYARSAARAAATDHLRASLGAAAVLALAFLVGQLSAWRQLNAAGFFAASNPANAFFYLLTGVHGLHLAGGLTALARTAAKAWRHTDGSALRQSVELCAIYWHFMLFVWVVIFALLTGWGDDFAVICRKLLA